MIQMELCIATKIMIRALLSLRQNEKYEDITYQNAESCPESSIPPRRGVDSTHLLGRSVVLQTILHRVIKDLTRSRYWRRYELYVRDMIV
jgi:hypothetical protein